MRIAIVINTSWNIYNFRKGLIKNLIENGHEVYAIAPTDDYSQKLIDLGCHYIPVNLDNKGSNPKYDLYFLFDIYKIYKEIKPDVVLHYTIKPNIYGTLASSWLGIPAINNVSGLGTVFLRSNLTSKIALKLYRFAFKFPKKVFFQNNDDRSLFIKKKLVKSNITDVLPGSGIDLNHFKPSIFKRNQVFTFLLVARLIYDKGIVEFVEAARILKKEGINAKFQLLGFIDKSTLGITLEELNTWVNEGLVEYLGKTEDVRPSIHDADCVVLPSYREGVPRTLLEASALAKPIIATNVPGCTEVVQHGENGYLCEAKDPIDLSEMMKKIILLDDKDLKEMGRKSRAQVEKRFDEQEVVRKYNQALMHILGIKHVVKKQAEPVLES